MTVEEVEARFDGRRWQDWSEVEEEAYVAYLEPADLTVPLAIKLALKWPLCLGDAAYEEMRRLGMPDFRTMPI
jgi:hypothetical protein